jgi:hypothetical protein
MPIVKVLRPDSSHNPNQPWLIYDKDGRYVQIREACIPDYIKRQMDSRVESFAIAEWRDLTWNLLTISRADYKW